MSELTKKINKKDLSPMMSKYLDMKENYKDCMLFYRLGDFYELFFDDAIEASKVLDLTLTGKSCGLEERAPMCGVPYHAAEGYIAKLIAKGYKVAICEQLGTEPRAGEKVVDRDVVKIVTAGTVTDDSMLDESKNNYIMALCKNGDKLSVCFCDITTGDFGLCSYDENLEGNLSDILSRLQPSQVIGNSDSGALYKDLPLLKTGAFPRFEAYFDYAFSVENAKSLIPSFFGENAISVFELSKEELPVIGGILQYLQETQKRSLKNINKIIKIKNSNYLCLDMNTRRNLELVESIRERKRYGSLLWLMDKTETSMGARRFRFLFDHPSTNSTEINERLDAVEELSKNLILRDKLSQSLSQVRDIERACGKIAYGNITPVELVNLKLSLQQIPVIRQALQNVTSKRLLGCLEHIKDFTEIANLLEKAIRNDAGSSMKEGEYIKAGFNVELDSLRNAKETADAQCKELERLEREQTGIKNLRISSNNVFGYYIEVSKGQKDLVPLRYIRKQTLATGERYTTADLKQIEERILNSKENALKLEEKLYAALLEYLSNFLKDFEESAKAIADVDALLSLAQAAVLYNFTKPTINRNVKKINIVGGRHPIVEKFAKENSFIANDTFLDNDENKMMIITGPNMAGKSTYMRQVAIITFLAHIGSFVPAKSAEISITDRIFTRVGASDDLAFGQSTFMVEMSEVANILANATEKSLVILDEIGRGTSTFDGLAIAWAVVEYIAKNLKCKTLFATHYHELSELEGVISGVKNYKITVKEINDTIVFLRKIVRGHANKSFGIEVARLAGVPEKVIDRAKEISINLENVNQKLDLDIFGENEERMRKEKNNKLGQKILSILKDIDMNRVTPMESFEMLNDLVNKAKE